MQGILEACFICLFKYESHVLHFPGRLQMTLEGKPPGKEVSGKELIGSAVTLLQRTELSSQYPCSKSQTPVAPVPGYLTLTSGFHSSPHICSTHNSHTYTMWVKVKLKNEHLYYMMEVSVVSTTYVITFNLCFLTQNIGRYSHIFSGGVSLCI